MPSLRQLLESHAPLLLIDAASARVQVSWLAAARGRDEAFTGKWEFSDSEAGIGIFQCVDRLGVRVEQAGAFVFCDGPGSVLGIRTVATALRTWRLLNPRPMFAYTSLAIVAHALGRSDVAVIADARRESWHVYKIGTGLRRVPAQDVAQFEGELVMPEGFRAWSAMPANVTRVPYSLADLLPRVLDADLFLGTDAPDAFLHEEPSYVTWTPQIHRAPGER